MRTLREESREDTDPERFALVSRGSSFAITGTETIMRGAVEKSARRGNGKHRRLIVPYETTDNDFSLFADSLFPSAGSNPIRSSSNRERESRGFWTGSWISKRRGQKRIIVSSILSRICLSIAIFISGIEQYPSFSLSNLVPIR